MNQRKLILILTLLVTLCPTLVLSSACSPIQNEKSFALQRGQTELKPGDQAGRSTSTTAIVKSRKANLRAKPSRAAAIVKEVEKGDLLTLVSLDSIGPWYRVREGKGTEGWIHGNGIALQEPPTVTTSSNEPTETPPRSTGTQTKPGRSYINVDGERVPSPVFSDSRPEGASARCRDGSYSFSRHRRGTCSHHGGVAVWF